MQKRGLSTVITTLIIILLVLVAIGIVWVAVRNILKQGTEEISASAFPVSLEVKRVVINQGSIDVTVKRNTGKANLAAIKFIISDGIQTRDFERDTNLGELGEQTFNLIYKGLVKEISIAPIVETSNEEERLLAVADSRTFTDKEIIENLGAVSWWKMDGDADDEIGGNQGTLYGNLNCNVQGKFGKACSFDGIDDYIEILDSPEFDIGSEGFTYSAWINPKSLPYTYNMFMGHHLPYFDVYPNARLHMSMLAGGAQRSVSGATALSLGNWYHAVATYDNQGYMKVYLNGVQDGVAGPWTPAGNYNYNQYIGTWSSSYNYNFTGEIDEPMIFNRALSAEQVQALYAMDLS